MHRRVAAGAPAWLAPGGSLLIETGRRQAEHTAAAVAGAGLRPEIVSSDEAMCTVVVGTLPGGEAASLTALPAGRTIGSLSVS